MNLVRAFFPKSGHFSLNFKKGQGKIPPLPTSSYAPADTYTFTSTLTGESFKINHQLNCNDRFIIFYLLTWKQYQKQHTGETTDEVFFL